MSSIQSQFMWADGSHIYKKYKKHDKGYVILGPPLLVKLLLLETKQNKIG